MMKPTRRQLVRITYKLKTRERGKYKECLSCIEMILAVGMRVRSARGAKKSPDAKPTSRTKKNCERSKIWSAS